MDSLAITDHGALYGAIDFYRAAKAAGIKPIIGCEIYVAPNSRHGKAQEDKTPYHLTVLAKDAGGYRNLVKLVSAAHLEGFYYKPRVDRELLERHREGLVVLSGCPSGEVPGLIAQGRMEDARSAAAWFAEVFPDYYLELMEHGGVDDLPAINKGLMELHRDLGIPVVATNDSHYIRQEDAYLQDILLCIHTNTNVQDEGRLKMTEDSYYLKSAQEMQALYPDVPEAITNTQAIAEMCNLELDFSQLHLYQYKLPDGVTADQHLAQACREGLERRIPDAGPEEEERLAYELDVVQQTSYADYFLVAWDIASFARDNNILLAVRGSAAGSLVLYCLGVTDVNPLSYRILFERFLNVERKQMPDIDMDFQDDRRQEIFEYVVSRYGREHVAQIITFGTLGARASIRDVGRALAIPYADVDQIARLVPARLHITLQEAMEESPELQEMYGADESIKRLLDTARSLEGTTRHSSTHAAGLVISNEPLDSYVPVQLPIKGDDQGITMTQYSMGPIEALGLLKLDILGLVNLTILAKGQETISKMRGVEIALRNIPLDDSETFALLSRGDTVGVFQLEGSGMTRYIKDLKPSSVSDVAAMIALYRPGPMEHIGTFIEAKHGLREPEYPHPALRDILQETYGVIVYQDQVLLIAQAFAGYTLGEADIVRRAMGKKIPGVMAQERERFIDGALKQGHSRELAEDVFALIEPFAGYAFGKAHSVSYGLISYWTAYLKAHYPEEYMVCLLNAYVGNSDKLANSVTECRRLKIPVQPPDVNTGEAEFSVQGLDGGRTGIDFGLAAIKNVGPAAVRPIIEARQKEGAFTSIEHMCRVADMSGLNRKTLESLIRAGAFDSFGDRGAILESAGRIIAVAQSEASLRGSNQASMFDLFGQSVPTPLAHIDLPDVQTTDKEKQAWEKELLGVAFSGNNLLHNIAEHADTEAIMSRGQIGPDLAGNKIMIVGQVSGASQRVTREQKPYTIASLALMDGAIDVFIWEDRQQETEGLWEEGTLVTVVGRVRARDDRVSISCLSASPFTVPEEDRAEDHKDARVPAQREHPLAGGDDRAPVVPVPGQSPGPNGGRQGIRAAHPEASATASSRRLTLRLRETDQPVDDQDLLTDVSRLLLEYKGEDSVNLEIASDGRVVTMEWPLIRVNICPPLEDALAQLLGSNGKVLVEEGGR
jgi:DNA polymerase-3 subunit alpha